jgi:hypothetical protein
MARPPKDPRERLRPVTIHLNPESADLLDQHARSRGLTRGGLVSSVLKRLTFPSENTPKYDQTGHISPETARKAPK